MSVLLLSLSVVLCATSGRCQAIPGTPSTLQAQATAERDRGNLPQAIVLYRQALGENPQWLNGWWFLGNLLYRSDQYAQAREALDHYVLMSPNAPAALALRGLCEFETEAYETSLRDIQRALSLGAANQSRNGQILLYHEALLLTRLGRFEEATAKYILFVKQGMTNQDIAMGLGLAGLRMPLLPQAIPTSETALVAETGQAAVVLLTKGSVAGRQAFRKVLEDAPGQPYVHYFCGYLLYTTAPDEAIDEFKLELEISPGSALAHSMLAWAYEFRGGYDEALPNARAAVTENPTLVMSQLVLGRALVETDDLNGGVTHLDRVVQADPANLEAHVSLAKAYSKLGRKADARRERLLSLELAGGGAAADANR